MTDTVCDDCGEQRPTSFQWGVGDLCADCRADLRRRRAARRQQRHGDGPGGAESHAAEHTLRPE